MPPRTSPSSQSLRRAVAYHASQITILWIVVLFMTIGSFLVILFLVSKLELTRIQLALTVNELGKAEQLIRQMSRLTQPAAGLPTSAFAPSAAASSAASPSGALVRGSLSPDGTKYAGYNDAVKSKIGIAVEILATGKVRYVELFPKADSTGSGTASESGMSVRWKDDSTIEYDVLVTKSDGRQVKETRTTQIYY